MRNDENVPARNCMRGRRPYGAVMRELIGVAGLFVSLAAVGVPAAEAWLPIENQVAEATQADSVTIVHFWAPWCSNCQAELKSGGWKTFIEANPKVKVIFVTVRDERDGAGVLAKFGLGPQKNFEHLQHPNPSRRPETEMTSFMGLRVGWTPATWIYRNGRQRYALNYGQIRFPILQQLVDDTDPKWD
jgi:thiol-disulfide isomerase/thioredoxin